MNAPPDRVAQARRLMIALACLASGGALVAPAVARAAGQRSPVAKSRVVFGHSFGPYQSGFGHPHPARVGYGGDGTADMEHLRWKHWGQAKATALGVGRWVWPGQSVATGTVSGTVHVVVSRIRTCRGVRMYTRMVRWIPRYGELYHPSPYQDLCKTDHFPPYHEPGHCSDVSFPDGGVATSLQVSGVTCETATALIVASPAERYTIAGGGRWQQDGYFCATDGIVETVEGRPSYGCSRDLAYLLFELQ
jgi:hypothetical protein